LPNDDDDDDDDAWDKYTQQTREYEATKRQNVSSEIDKMKVSRSFGFMYYPS
jgi:hypothetical protein